jgi:cytochrome b
MALLVPMLVAVQAGTGLFATDDIFNEGPLTRFVASDVAGNVTWVHRRVFWLIIATVSVHVFAQIVYGIRGNPTPLAMFTGRKAVDVEPATPHLLLGMITAAGAATVIWAVIAYV